MDPKLLKVRQRLRDDFEFYASNALKIRTKEAEVIPFTLNDAQRQLMEAIELQMASEGRVRIIVLKARQLGLSTMIGGWIYSRVSQRAAQKAIVLTHRADSTNALFDMTKRFHDNCPEALKPSTKYSSKRELKFDKLDSGYAVATAGGEAIARGETFTLAHLSEAAFYPKSTAKEVISGLLDAIPNTKGTAVFVESTANGVSGPYYEMWQAAVRGESGYIAVFIPWFVDPTYREAVPDGFERTPTEEDLVERFGLDDAQLMYRRRKISEKGIELWGQEYPSTPEEAFLTTGRPVFNSQQLARLADEAPLPMYSMGLVNETIQKDPRGELLVYRDHDPAETYYIGADIAMGVRGGDYSVAQVLDSKKRQVATWRGHIHPDYFATTLKALGEYYNMALIAPESNAHGILTVTRLSKDLGYPYVWTEVVHDKMDDKETVNIGFRTNVKTKPLIIDQLRASMRECEIELVDKQTIQEMLTYIVTDTGAMEAEEGCFDDTVMALAIANYVHEGSFEPVDVTDDYFIQAI